MGLFSRFKKQTKESIRVGYGSPASIASFSHTEALENSAFWSCVVNLSRLYATLPWHVFEHNKNGDRIPIDRTRPLAALLRQPNQYMDSYQFKFIMGFNFEMHGVAIAIIQRSSSGIPIALYPVSPSQVVGYWKDNELFYTVATSGTSYPASDMLVISNTPTGYTSVLSPIQYASSDLDLETKCKKMQKEYYEGGSVLGNTVKVPKEFTKEQRDEIRGLFNSSLGRYRNYVVDDRIEITPIQIPTNDISKLAEAQKWNTAEVARRFNVPPFLIGDTTGTYNNSEQQGILMVTYCLQPRMSAWEIALDSKLCYSKQYIKFNLSSLMRGDHAARAAYYHNAVMDGWMSVNEIRRLEDLPGIGKDGDVHFFPMNYASLSDIVSGRYSSGNNIWDIPTKEKETKHEEKIEISEKRERDLAFIEEARKPATTNRAKIQHLLKKQVKAEIEKIKQLVATGQDASSCLTEFMKWINENAAEMQPAYKNLYLSILKSMIPTIQKTSGKDGDIDEDKMDEFASSYTTNLVGRHTGYVCKRISQTIGTEDFDDACQNLQDDLPISEAEEEVNRSSNAFSVFLFSALGIQYMHVVASVNACPFCQSLDGKITSVNGYILQKGADVDDGDGAIRHISKNYKHPPFHTHCECGVAPGK